MKTTHRIIIGDARERLDEVASDSVGLVVTSPPYPMIEMWDEAFAAMAPGVAASLEEGRGLEAFEAMHQELDRVWSACHRVLMPGGIACINIGDATRTIAGDFRLFHNHARILEAAARLGFCILPDILWRKPNNGPNKFMGSGMLPAGAYVTYEHEYILILRKGSKREFKTAADKELRRKSAFFWEERNAWFSDIWTDLRGSAQTLQDRSARERSAAFPFELARRLILMYSLYGDVVLDPFAGTGTTLAAAAAQGRSSIGLEHEPELCSLIEASLASAVELGRSTTEARLRAHRAFVESREASGKTLKHRNEQHGFAVMTKQEVGFETRIPGVLTRTAAGFFEMTHEALRTEARLDAAAESGGTSEPSKHTESVQGTLPW